MSEVEEVHRVNIPFKLPGTNFIICGETNSGKSVWIEKLLRHKDEMLSPPPSKVLLLYRKNQSIYEQWRSEFPFLETAEGINKVAIESQKDDPTASGGTLLILDDLMVESATDPYMMNCYTAGRHYGFSGIITVWHNLMPKAKNARLISLNVTVFVLMRSPRISSQVATLGSQLGIRKPLIQAYRMATENRPYSYLVVDYSDRQSANAWRYALRTNIFPQDIGHTTVFGTPSAEGEVL